MTRERQRDRTPPAWFCELHRLTTTTDCPKCDDEQIADLERYERESDQAVRESWLAAATYGMCTACGAIEVALLAATGTRDYSAIGESPEYPTGYGCEMCS